MPPSLFGDPGSKWRWQRARAAHGAGCCAGPPAAACGGGGCMGSFSTWRPMGLSNYLELGL